MWAVVNSVIGSEGSSFTTLLDILKSGSQLAERRGKVSEPRRTDDQTGKLNWGFLICTIPPMTKTIRRTKIVKRRLLEARVGLYWFGGRRLK